MTRIALDALLLSGTQGYRSAGIHRYIDGLLRHLPAAAPDLQFTAWVGSAAGGEALAGEGLAVEHATWPVERPVARIAWEQLMLPGAAARSGAGLLHALAYVLPAAGRLAGVVTVYDLSFYRTPERFRFLNRWYLRTFTRRSCRRARRVIAISESTRRDVVALLGVPADRVDVACPGVGPAFRPLPAAEVADFRRRKGLPERFILYLGTIEPRKNLVTLVDAYARLRGEARLVLAGGRGWLYEEVFARIEALGLGEDVVCPGYVPLEELPWWYNAASAFAYPSAYEGFGIPVVEALACGTPVVTTNVSALPEAAGPVGAQVPPGDVDALASALAAALDDAGRRAAVREEGPAWAARFNWAATAAATAAGYRRALEDSRRDELA